MRSSLIGWIGAVLLGSAAIAQVDVPAVKPPMIFEPQTLRDPRTQLDVGTLLIPRGWQINPGVLWRPQLAYFVTLETAVFDPQTGWALRWIPLEQFNASPTLYASAVQQGQSLLTVGGMQLIDRVLSPRDYILQIVLPRYRNIPGIRVTGAEDLPDLGARLMQASGPMVMQLRQAGQELRIGAGRVRVEYPGPGGVTLEEEIYCVIDLTWSEQGNTNAMAIGQPGLQSWLISPSRIYSFTAPKGQLQAAAPVLHTVYASLQATPQWHAFVMNLAAMFRQAAINDQQMIAAARAQITESQRRTWEERTKQMSVHSNVVGHLLSNTQAYTNPNNPNGPPIVLPAGNTPWMGANGQITTTSSPNVTPAQQAASSGQAGQFNNQNWTPLQPAQP